MTFNDLSQLYYLRGEINDMQARKAELADRCDLQSPAYGDRVQSGRRDSSIERYAVAVADLDALIREKEQACLEEEYRLTQWIYGIPDSFIRRAFWLRFVKGLRWRKVAFEIGGGNTEHSIFMACKRYLEENSEKSETC